jgi:hypothetical protein
VGCHKPRLILFLHLVLFFLFFISSSSFSSFPSSSFGYAIFYEMYNSTRLFCDLDKKAVDFVLNGAKRWDGLNNKHPIATRISWPETVLSSCH